MTLFDFVFFQRIWGTGFFLFFHAPKCFSSEGPWFESTLARPSTPRDRVTGKLLVLLVSVVCSLIPLPVLI